MVPPNLLGTLAIVCTLDSVITTHHECFDHTNILLGQMFSFEQKLAKIEKRASFLETENVELRNTVQELQTEIRQLNNQTNGISNKQDILKIETFNDSFTLQRLQTRLTNLEGQHEDLNKTVKELGIDNLKSTDHIKDSLNKTYTNLQIQLEIQSQQIQDQNNTMTSLWIHFGELQGKVAEFNNTAAETVAAVEENTAKIIKIEEQVSYSNWTNSAPFFTVRLTDNTKTAQAMETMIFSQVVTDVHNDYNATDGVFRPPVSGRYVFSLSVRSYNREDAQACVMKNNKIVGVAVSIGGRQIWGSTGAITIVLDLYQEDKVRVAGLYANETYHGITTFFTGYLLYPMKNNTFKM